MARHHLDPAPRALHGYFSRELAPALTIDSGDVVSFQTLDAGWGAIEQEAAFSKPRDFVPRDVTRDVAHALAGPVAFNGARAGMTLEIRINRIRTGRWGWSAGPGSPAQLDPHLGLGPGLGRARGGTARRNHRAARRSRGVLGTRPGKGSWHQPYGSTAEAATVHGNNGYAPRSTGYSIYLSPHPMRRQSGLPRANGRYGVVFADRSRWGAFLNR